MRGFLSSLLFRCRFCRTVFLLAVFWVMGFVGYINQSPRHDNFSPTTRFQSGVILTGGPGFRRIEQGINFLLTNQVERLLISGVDPSVSLPAILTPASSALTGENINWLSCCIDLGYEARDTIGNAKETKYWVERHGYQELLVITSDYHLLRSMTELQMALPHTKLYYSSVPSDFLKSVDDGKINVKYLWKLAEEYNKFLLVAARQWLEEIW